MRGSPLVLLVLAAALAGTSCAGGDDGAVATSAAPPPSTAGAPASSLYDLRTGDCFSGLDRNQDLLVRPRPCASPHQAEIYGTVELTASRFPGAEVLGPRAATACAQQFAGYTGEPAGPGTELGFVEIVPTLASWSSGDRQALCVALGVDGVRLEASIADGGGT